MPIYIDIDPSYAPVNVLGINTRAELFIDKEVPIRAADGATWDTDFKLVFYTEANPMYASVDYILLKGGEFLEDIPEAAIYLMGFTASTLVDDMILFDPNEMFKDKTSQRWYFFNRARTEAAACNAILKLFRGVIASRGTSAGRKALADFSIDTGPLGNLLQSARPFLRDLTDECLWWRNILYSGGAPDHDRPMPKAAVKSGYNPKDNAAGIGRGWEVGGATLNERTAATRHGNSWTRPVRYGHPKYYSSVYYPTYGTFRP